MDATEQRHPPMFCLDRREEHSKKVIIIFLKTVYYKKARS
jgi:hypothetical protein